MQYSNLHTHTTFSDGKNTPEENILSAIDGNMLSLGVSDHSDTYCDSGYCMKKEQYSAYIREIWELKKKYAGKIPVYLGLEKDYYSTVNRENYDYLISSVHYIVKNGICHPIDHSAKQQHDCIEDAFHGNVLDMAKCYFDMVAEHVICAKPTLVGHFDVITKFGIMPENDHVYRKICIDALHEVLKTCPFIEINTGGISRGWRNVPYPVPFLLDEILASGGEVVLSSDSHSCDNLTFYFDESVILLKQVGFDHISVFNGTGFDRMPI